MVLAEQTQEYKTKKVMLPAIQVLNPRTHNTWDEGRYTTYDISIQTEHKSYYLTRSLTGRRYSEFAWLRKTLKSHHPSIKTPKLPPRKIFANKFDRMFLEERRKGLEVYLNTLQKEILYLSDTTFHLFVQTDLSTHEINAYLHDKLSDAKIDKMWLAGGKKSVWQSKKSDYLPTSASCPDRLFAYSGDDDIEDDEDDKQDQQAKTEDSNISSSCLSTSSDTSDNAQDLNSSLEKLTDNVFAEPTTPTTPTTPITPTTPSTPTSQHYSSVKYLFRRLSHRSGSTFSINNVTS